MTVVGAAECDLRHGVVQHPGTDRMPFGVVGVQQALGRRPLDHLGQLPSQVHGILHARVEALAALRGMHVGGVAGQQDPTVAIGRRLPRHVGEPGDPAGAAEPEVRPVGDDECLAEILQGGLAGVFEVLFDQDNPVRSVVSDPADATTLAAHAELRLLVHLDLGDDPAGRGIQPGEVDPGGLADQAASSVAADEILRPERRVPGHLDIDAGVVLREAHHLPATKDRNPELTDPVRQDGLEEALPQRRARSCGGWGSR